MNDVTGQPQVINASPELDQRAKLAQFLASMTDSLMTDLFHKSLKTSEKTSDDYVTELDRSIESMCLKNIQQSFPNDGMFGEEDPGLKSKNGYEWIVDPIDGTNNFVRGLPLCGFQLAVLYNGEVLHSLVLRPFTQEWFTATKGQGAVYINKMTGEESPLRVANRSLEQAMVIFDPSIGRSDNPATQILANIADDIAAVRAFGTSTFDIPAIASGQADILVTGIANKYDVAAGSLLVIEAGGAIYNLDGDTPSLDDKFMIFSSQANKEPLLKLIKRSF